MAWTTPKTWTANEVPDESDFNINIRDNLNALKAPPFGETALSATSYSNIQSTSTVFANLMTGTVTAQIQLATYGGDIEVHFEGSIHCDSTCALNFTYNGTAYADEPFGLCVMASPQVVPITFSRFVTGLPSGTHTFRPQWLTTNGANPIQLAPSAKSIFWVRETS